MGNPGGIGDLTEDATQLTVLGKGGNGKGKRKSKGAKEAKQKGEESTAI